jgi:DNA-binding NarL/FixJ family response regulator
MHYLACSKRWIADYHLNEENLIGKSQSGSETYQRLRRIDPAVKVLLSSGYSIEGKANEILALGCNGVIQKPFTMDELSQKICSILEETENPSEAKNSRRTE